MIEEVSHLICVTWEGNRLPEQKYEGLREGRT